MTPDVVSLTIPRPTTSKAQDVSLIMKLSKGLTKLVQDADAGKFIPEVDITLAHVGNGSTDTISLTSVLISSIQFLSAGDVPEVEITLAAQGETIRNS